MTIFMREVSPNFAAGELTFQERVPVDVPAARRQHEELQRVLGDVVCMPALLDHPDCVFVEDTMLVLDELAIRLRPGAATRRGEVDSVAAAVGRVRPVVELPEPATLEGGDVLRVGRTLYVGLSSRTNGADALAALVTPLGYSVVPVLVEHCLHLKTACTYLGRDTLLANPEWVSAEPFAGLKVIATEEPGGGNTLTVGDKLFVSGSYPRTAARLREAGFSPTEVDISEFHKLEGGLTCLCLVVS